MRICGLGVDLVEISRIEKAYKANAKLADRILRPGEVAYCALAKRGWASRLATCFAVKEAGAKALGTGIGQVGWKDIELGHAPSGAPILRLHGPALKAFQDLQGGDAHLSLSHEKGMVLAVVILEKP